ncbi:MAG: alpha/beta fold hydrolase [Dehalococcoidia bacterium]|nr:alpha/beta fold hydrolase [Dehalococcoidia bacterium]
MPHADSRGAAARIYYEAHGSGPPLLLISGFGSNATVYWANIPRLSERFRVIVMDPRGSGRSDVTPGPYTMQLLADDCVAVLNACGVHAAHLLGTSMGGMIAQHVALGHPERVRGLVLACTTPGGAHHVLPPPEHLAVFVAAAEIADAVEAVRATYRLHYSDLYAAAHDAEIVARSRANERLRSTPEGRAAQLAAVQAHDTFDLLPSITAPTLVAHGERDGIVPVENGRSIAARIPGARLRTWADGRHLFFVEFADEFNEAVISFLDEADVRERAVVAGEHEHSQGGER